MPTSYTLYEEFAGTSIDTTKWAACEGTGWDNGAQQYTPLTSANPNLYLSGGNLVIEARRENGGFTSGRLESIRRQTYGLVNIRAKLDKQQNGVWPAVWLVGNDPWPDHGELDTMEWFGLPGSPPESHLHSLPDYNRGWVMPSNVNVTEWHVYGVEWRSNFLRFTVDGREVGYTTPTDYGNGWASFGNPQRVILNVAVNTTQTWMPAVDATFTKAQMLVDYVCWYQ